jgi:membrane protease YdiL (CAAX protease family)
MTNVLNILCQSSILDSNQVLWSDQSFSLEALSIAFAFILFVGTAFLIYWLVTTSFGTTSLDQSRPRRNAMVFYIPLIPFGIWILLSSGGVSILNRFEKSLPEYQQQLLTLAVTAAVAIVLLITIVILVRQYFVRGLKGFGLDPQSVWRDFAGALAKLLAVWPLVLAILWLTLAVGKLIYGPDFQLEEHEELKVLVNYPQWPVKLGVVFLAVVLAPLAEEMLFRGLFQTTFRNLTRRPWIAIIFTSVLFALSHAIPEHWPALFVLAVGLGYAYEKSGSLLQPIFMHAIFNGAMVTATLLQG